jgi:hypothetical protein
MQDPITIFTSIVAVVLWPFQRTRPLREGPGADSGAVSIEQVLWYAAAAVSVAVVAAILWSQIRTTASTPVQAPSAP